MKLFLVIIFSLFFASYYVEGHVQLAAIYDMDLPRNHLALKAMHLAMNESQAFMDHEWELTTYDINLDTYEDFDEFVRSFDDEHPPIAVLGPSLSRRVLLLHEISSATFPVAMANSYASSPELLKTKDLVHSAFPSDIGIVVGAVDLVQSLGFRRVVVLSTDSDFSRDSTSLVKERLENAGVQVPYYGNHKDLSNEVFGFEEVVRSIDLMLIDAANSYGHVFLYHGLPENVNLLLQRARLLGLLGEPSWSEWIIMSSDFCTQDLQSIISMHKDNNLSVDFMHGILCIDPSHSINSHWVKNIWEPAANSDVLTNDEKMYSGMDDWTGDNMSIIAPVSYDAMIAVIFAIRQICGSDGGLCHDHDGHELGEAQYAYDLATQMNKFQHSTVLDHSNSFADVYQFNKNDEWVKVFDIDVSNTEEHPFVTIHSSFKSQIPLIWPGGQESLEDMEKWNEYGWLEDYSIWILIIVTILLILVGIDLIIMKKKRAEAMKIDVVSFSMYIFALFIMELGFIQSLLGTASVRIGNQGVLCHFFFRYPFLHQLVLASIILFSCYRHYNVIFNRSLRSTNHNNVAQTFFSLGTLIICFVWFVDFAFQPNSEVLSIQSTKEPDKYSLICSVVIDTLEDYEYWRLIKNSVLLVLLSTIVYMTGRLTYRMHGIDSKKSMVKHYVWGWKFTYHCASWCLCVTVIWILAIFMQFLSTKKVSNDVHIGFDNHKSSMEISDLRSLLMWLSLIQMFLLTLLGLILFVPKYRLLRSDKHWALSANYSDTFAQNPNDVPLTQKVKRAVRIPTSDNDDELYKHQLHILMAAQGQRSKWDVTKEDDCATDTDIFVERKTDDDIRRISVANTPVTSLIGNVNPPWLEPEQSLIVPKVNTPLGSDENQSSHSNGSYKKRVLYRTSSPINSHKGLVTDHITDMDDNDSNCSVGESQEGRHKHKLLHSIVKSVGSTTSARFDDKNNMMYLNQTDISTTVDLESHLPSEELPLCVKACMSFRGKPLSDALSQMIFKERWMVWSFFRQNLRRLCREWDIHYQLFLHTESQLAEQIYQIEVLAIRMKRLIGVGIRNSNTVALRLQQNRIKSDTYAISKSSATNQQQQQDQQKSFQSGNGTNINDFHDVSDESHNAKDNPNREGGGGDQSTSSCCSSQERNSKRQPEGVTNNGKVTVYSPSKALAVV